MLRLHYSNRTEALLQALVARLDAARSEGRSALEPVHVVVPNRNMQRYLELGIAQTLGVAANLVFHRLERFVGEWLEQRAGSVRVADRLLFESRLLDTLLDERALQSPELGPVRAYLQAGGDDPDAMDLRRVQLALRLSSLFEEYTISRPRMVDAWLGGASAETGRAHADAEPWQRALFLRCLRGDDGASALPVHRAVLAAASTATHAAPDAEVHVFGLSYVGRVFHWALAALGQERDVHVYALNPCMEFWEDVPSAGELRVRGRLGRRGETSPRGSVDVESLEEHPALAGGDAPALVLWGRPGREHIHLLDELTGCDFNPCFVDPRPQGPTLLSQVQYDILTRAPERTDPEETFAFSGDRSIQVLACPGVRREVEAVADGIWRLVREHDEAAGDPPLRFNDIAVLVNGPDRDLYMPHIHAVFDEAHRIPHTVMDLPLASASRVAEAAGLLLDLPLGRLTRREVLDVITHPAVRGRAPEVEAGAWSALTARLGIFHGADHRDHAGTYIARDVLNWDQGVRRLVLGAFMTGEASGDPRAFVAQEEGEEGGTSTGYLPEEHDEPGDLTFALLVRSLLADVHFARHARLPLEAWARFMSALVSGYLVPGNDAEESDLRRCLTALASLAERDPGGRDVSYRVAVELARRVLGDLGGSRGEYLTQGVAVSTLVPMRAVPFRAVFVLGLSEGRFPAAEGRDTLDLRTARRQVGDVSPTERDEYAFLEALLSARHHLTLSYVARDELTGDPIAPSPVVERLLDVLERGYLRDARTSLLHTVPLRRFDRDPRTQEVVPCLPEAGQEALARALGDAWRAHHGSAEPTTADPSRAAALAALQTELGADWEPVRALLRIPPATGPRVEATPDEGDEVLVVPLTHLRRFLECPLQGWARAVVGIADEEDDPGDMEEDEPFVPSPLDETMALRHVFLTSLREGRAMDDVYREEVARREARGRWPTGDFATRRAETDVRILGAWRASLEHAGLADGGRPRRLRFGPDTEHGDADEVLSPLTFHMADPRPGRGGQVRVEISGRTEPLLGSPRASLLLVPRELGGQGVHKTRRLRHALRAFFDHVMLSAGGHAGAHTAAIVDVPPEGKENAPIRAPIRLAPMVEDRARAWLEDRVREMYAEPHAYFMPCEAVLRKFGGFDRLDAEGLASSIEHVRNPFKEYRGGSSRYGPVPDAVARPAPPADTALALARDRFGLFFELADLEALR